MRFKQGLDFEVSETPLSADLFIGLETVQAFRLDFSEDTALFAKVMLSIVHFPLNKIAAATFDYRATLKKQSFAIYTHVLRIVITKKAPFNWGFSLFFLFGDRFRAFLEVRREVDDEHSDD